MDNPRILVAYEDDMYRVMLCLMLRRRRPHVQLIDVNQAQAAYVCYQQGGVDLVVTDEQLLLPNGVDLAAVIRAEHPTLPIVTLSNKRTSERAIGSDERTRFLTKPVLIDDLLTVIDHLLNSSIL